MNIHVRTAIKTWWSYIETALVQLGEDTLEITGGIGQIPYWINGKKTEDMQTGKAAIGDFLVEFKRINEHQTQTRISIHNTDAIGIETYKHLVRVNLKNNSNKSFNGSLGMLGAFPNGVKMARDGKTVINDPIEFGQEWQVLASEPQLFHTTEGAAAPGKCLMPDTTEKAKERRRLGEAAITEEQAAVACSRVGEFDRDACIFDVLATNDKDVAGSY